MVQTEAIVDNEWILAMQEELNQFTRNDVWYLVPRPTNTNVIGTKWIFKNKTDEKGNVVRNKALYGLKQAPRAWYERLSSHLLLKGYTRDIIDKTLFVKRVAHDLMVVQIYVDDIVFGSTSNALVSEFTDVMQNEFEMSMSGELTYFLGLQVQQLKDGMFLSQTKYAKDLVSKFGLESAKPITNPMSTTTKLHKDLIGKYVDQTLYKSMIGSLLYLTASRPDISFSVGVCARF
ncbi:uncharacterized protein LOC110759390 [Prunus avium]|uniref:Uncharacterized protein LOC110759390 n=1 Tax=Prunus avium TaxID=42229 RepID=A0A6P5SM07_PRUAV|nr:uncharacterized protein LOC110759390 [Prunus avium]